MATGTLSKEALQKMVDDIAAEIKKMTSSPPSVIVLPPAPEFITIDFTVGPKKSKVIPTIEDL